MSEACIVTYTGVLFDILNPKPEMINIVDIAHSGSQMNRFTGHCRVPYPVTQHERLGSYLIDDSYLALWFLLHDASESYISDMSRPLKHFTAAGQAYMKVEAPLQTMIYEKFGLYGPEPPIVHEVDNLMLYAEKEQLMAPTKWPTKWSDERAAGVKIVETSFYDNKRMYLDRFWELYHGDWRRHTWL